MRLFLQLAALLTGGLAVGLGAGFVTLGQASTPPDAIPTSASPLAPAVAARDLPAATTPTQPGDRPAPPVPAQVGTRAGTPPAAEVARPAAAQAGLAPVPPGPDSRQGGVDPIEVSLVPRGPGRFALLDLQAAGVPQLFVRQGTLLRDGAANWATFVNRPKLTVLKGPQVRVEWLHLGFDAEARPIVAHVRTTGHAGGEVEGIVTLKIGAAFVPVRADAP